MRGPEFAAFEELVRCVDNAAAPIAEWTVAGRELGPTDRWILDQATPADWFALHDLIVLGALADGRPSPCPPRCPWCDPELTE